MNKTDTVPPEVKRIEEIRRIRRQSINLQWLKRFKGLEELLVAMLFAAR